MDVFKLDEIDIQELDNFGQHDFSVSDQQPSIYQSSADQADQEFLEVQPIKSARS